MKYELDEDVRYFQSFADISEKYVILLSFWSHSP